jgi:hypothetical protein
MTIKILKTFGKSRHLQSNCFLVCGARCVYNQFVFTATAGQAAAETARQTGPLTGLGEKEA